MDLETLKVLVDSDLHDRLDIISELCNAPYAVNNGIELVRASEDSVVMKKEVFPCDLNSNGVVHGAVSFGILDNVFGVTVNMRSPAVGLSCNVIYHRPCFGGILEAESKIVTESRSLITVDVSLRCENKLIATATCIAFKSERPKR